LSPRLRLVSFRTREEFVPHCSEMAFHGSVVRRDRSGEPARWIAAINSSALGEFLEREIAMHNGEIV
jgi:hypothetical protein